MGLFGSLFGGGINEIVEEARATEGSVIIDVRVKTSTEAGTYRLAQRAGRYDRARFEGGARQEDAAVPLLPFRVAQRHGVP